MISNSERRFINQWQEQKSGARWKYYLQFSIAWTMISFLIIFFLTKLFTRAWETGGRYMILLFIGLAIFSGLIITHLTYTLSEKRFRKIMSREEEVNKNKD